MTEEQEAPFVFLISDDLFFASRIDGVASGLGLKVSHGSDPNAAFAIVQLPACRGILLDLTVPNLEISSLVERIRGVSSLPIIAFGPHVATAKLTEAQDAGCEQVLPRSRFSAMLPEILKGLMVHGD